MDFKIVQPGGFLRNYVKYYCFMESGVHDPDVIERVIPTANVQLMFHYKNPFVVCQPDQTTRKQPRSIISGLSHSFSDVSTNGEAGVVFINFYPTGACHFFDFPLSEIENRSVDLSDLLSVGIRETEEKLYVQKSLSEKTATIDHFLLNRFAPIPHYDKLLVQSGMEIIKQCKGQTTATVLSENLSITTKSLERKFSHYLGKTTKQVIKLVRFQEILQDFSQHKNINLTEYAYRNGYFDQSHFIRDFKTYSGYTPKEFLTKYPDFDINANTTF